MNKKIGKLGSLQVLLHQLINLHLYLLKEIIQNASITKATISIKNIAILLQISEIYSQN